MHVHNDNSKEKDTRNRFLIWPTTCWEKTKWDCETHYKFCHMYRSC